MSARPGSEVAKWASNSATATFLVRQYRVEPGHVHKTDTMAPMVHRGTEGSLSDETTAVGDITAGLTLKKNAFS